MRLLEPAIILTHRHILLGHLRPVNTTPERKPLSARLWHYSLFFLQKSYTTTYWPLILTTPFSLVTFHLEEENSENVVVWRQSLGFKTLGIQNFLSLSVYGLGNSKGKSSLWNAISPMSKISIISMGASSIPGLGAGDCRARLG